MGAEPNPHIDPEHSIRFVRFKRPVSELIDPSLPRGQRAEDLVYELMRSTGNDSGAEDVRWDINLLKQSELAQRMSGEAPEETVGD